MKKTQDKVVFTLDELAILSGLPPWENIEIDCMVADCDEEEIYATYKQAVERATQYLLEWHRLDLRPIRDGCYRIVAPDGWRTAATQVRETINGYGLIYFQDTLELLHIGPYRSYKEVVLSHLHWIVFYPEIYGRTRAGRVFEEAWK